MRYVHRHLSVVLVLTLVSFSFAFLNVKPAAAIGATYFVTNTDPSGAGSLAVAIDNANGNPGRDAINFSIPGAGPHVITSFAALSVTEEVVFDGLSQPGSECGGQLNIIIDKTGLNNQSLTFGEYSADSVIQGIDWISGNSTNSNLKILEFNQTVRCNYFNMTSDGTATSSDPAYIYSGGLDFGASDSIIGGPNPEDANVFATDIRLDASSTLDNVTVIGNTFGFSADRSTYLGTRVGIELDPNNVLYTNLAIQDNLIQSIDGGAGSVPDFVNGLNISGNKLCVDDAVTTNVCAGANDASSQLINFRNVANVTLDGNYLSGTDVNATAMVTLLNATGSTVVQNNYVNLTLDGAGIVSNSQVEPGFDIRTYQGDVTVDSNHFVGTAEVGEYGDAVLITASTDDGLTTVSNNVFGLAIDGTTPLGFVQSAIAVGGDDAHVTGNIIKGGFSRDASAHGSVVAVAGNADGEVVVSDNTIENNEGTPLHIYGTASSLSVHDNTIFATHNYALSSSGTYGTTSIADNTIKLGDAGGIYVGNGTSTTITGNTVYGDSYSTSTSSNVGIKVDSGNPVLHGNTIHDAYDAVAFTSTTSFTAYDNVLYNNADKSYVIASLSEGTDNDLGDENTLLNYPVARRVQAAGSDSLVTFEVDLQPGDYRFELCYNTSGLFTSGSTTIPECQSVLGTVNKHNVIAGVHNLTMTVTGTGYQVALMTMTATQIVGPTDSDLGLSSVVGAPRGMSADLGISIRMSSPSVQPQAALSSFAVSANVCNSGVETVYGFTLDSHFTGLDLTGYEVLNDSIAANKGTLGSDGNWTGELAPSECLHFAPTGTVTGAKSTQLQWTALITSSIVSDEHIANEDTNASNDSDTDHVLIDDAADLFLKTRLMTSGAITAGSNVSYELDLQNIGDGAFQYPALSLLFILPANTTFTDVTDLNPDDGFNLTEDCESFGNINEQGPEFASYDGEFIACEFESDAGHIAPNSSFPMQFNMTASADFASGVTNVFGVVIGPTEPDTDAFMAEFGHGHDGFALQNNNNIFHLTYDTGALTVTINKCEGQADPTFEDDACFTVNFSKPIWGPSFTEDDIDLGGHGEISSFVQNSDTQWTVHVTGMTEGSTISLVLGPDSVVDLSAVHNDVHVLGQNTIRYRVYDADTDLTSTISSESTTSGSGADASSGSSGSLASDDAVTGEEAGTATVELKKGNDSAFSFKKTLSDVSTGKVAKVLTLGVLSLTGSNTLDMVMIGLNAAAILAAIHLVRQRRRVKR